MYLFLDLFCGFFPRFFQVELFGIPNERMFCEHFCKDQEFSFPVTFTVPGIL